MNAGHLSLEGLPMDIATALNRFGFAMSDCGGIEPGDTPAFIKTGTAAANRRAELVAAIKGALAVMAPAPAPAPVLPHAQTVRLGYDGDDFPEPGFALRLPPFDGVEDAQFAAREGVQA